MLRSLAVWRPAPGKTKDTAARSHQGYRSKMTPPPLAALIRQRKWQVLAEILEQGEQDDLNMTHYLEQGLSKADNKKKSRRGDGGGPYHETALHFLCRYDPPLALVATLIECLAQYTQHIVPEEATDAYGRNALHVLAYYGCSDARVVRRLVNGIGGVVPAVAKDSRDRFALHWAVCDVQQQSPSKSSWTGRHISKPQYQWHELRHVADTTSWHENRVKAFYFLLAAYPLAAGIPDADGATPLQLAVRNCDDQRVIQVLQIAAECHAAGPNLQRKVLKGNFHHNGGSHTETDHSSSCDDSGIPNQVLPVWSHKKSLNATYCMQDDDDDSSSTDGSVVMPTCDVSSMGFDGYSQSVHSQTRNLHHGPAYTLGTTELNKAAPATISLLPEITAPRPCPPGTYATASALQGVATYEQDVDSANDGSVLHRCFFI